MGSACLVAAQAVEVSVPDAPSATVTPERQNSRKLDFKLLVHRSRVFPDLATNSEHLSVKQKLQLSVNDSLSLAAVGGALFSAGLGQARDNLPGYGQGAEGFGKRFGTAMGANASAQFIGTFLLATAFRQDPRFFVQENPSLRQSIVYGFRRLVVTRTDGGQETLNTSGLLGLLAAQGLANAYLPDQERTAARTFRRYGISLALRAGANFAKQYWPKIFKSLANSSQKGGDAR
jgi:hypothetical protein